MRRSVLVAIAVVVVVAVLGTAGVVAIALAGRSSVRPGSAAGRTAPAPGPITWARCTDGTLAAARAECATVPVPLDWSHPRDGRTVRIAVSRVRHTATPYEGVVLANPGGPGGSGLGLATLGAQVPNGIGARYDWIGFDPRGVGASRPRLSCDADYADGPRPAYSPPTTDVLRRWRDRAEQYARDCAGSGALLDHMTTRDAARDLDQLRRALRVPAITYYGYSYGTYLGQVYATLHPDRVRRMVLDSTVDPTRVWYDANLDQDRAFETAISAWFEWLARHDDRYGLGGSREEVKRSYERLAADLADSPAAGELGPAELADTVLQAGYSQRLWPGLGRALADAARGRAAPMRRYWRALTDTRDDNGYAGYLAVECTDAPWPRDWATWERDTRRVDAAAPFGTWLNTWFNAPCRTWPAVPQQPVRVDGRRAPAVLMIDETLDAATPYSGSVAVRRLFPRARLLAEPGGTSHATSLSGNACVDRAVAAYLADGTLPARADGDGPDATCAPAPVPAR